MIHPYEEQVKRALIISFTNEFVMTVPPVEFAESLARMFRLKRKPIQAIARWVETQVARGHPLAEALDCIAFFAVVFRNEEYKANGQPIHPNE